MSAIKGLELSERFYKEYGEPMIKNEFPHLLDKIAVGLVGAGSECLGYDDDISTDHDFEAGFCILLPDEETVDRRSAFLLERAYSKLPREFMGYKRSLISPVGGNRHGVIRIGELLKAKTGTEDGELELFDWFYVPEQSLIEATNGKIFYDGLGKMTEVREKLSYLPDDVRLKKLAGELLIMGQSGQYNYQRCAVRGEFGAAQLTLSEFVKASIHACLLLGKKYMPYYKWSFRALRELPEFSHLAEPLTYLISSANTDGEIEEKLCIIERVAADIIEKLRQKGLSSISATELEAHAYEVNGKIKNAELRQRHVLFGV